MMTNAPLEDVSQRANESDQLAAPLDSVRSGFKVGFDPSQQMKMEVTATVLYVQVHISLSRGEMCRAESA